MNTEIRVSCSWRYSVNRKMLKRRLGAEGVIALLDLWAHVAEHHPTGSLIGMGSEDIALAAAWAGDPNTLVAELIGCGYLEPFDARTPQSSGYRVVGWFEEIIPVPDVTSSAICDALRSEARRKYQAEVFARDGFRCRYCSSVENLTLDHIFPLSRGGNNDLSNLATACNSCNSSKGNRTPEEWRAR